jgi:LacI family transcriptional regulator, galactose operon repressor
MTLEQVARQARVSSATVSRVLNNPCVVSRATRARVLQAVEELKYSPNLVARGLAAGSRSIGLIVSNFENPFFMDIYKAVNAGAGSAGFDVIMADTGYSPERLTAGVRMMIGRRVAGLAAIVSEMDPGLIAELKEYRIPTVIYDVGAPGPHIATIRVNYRRGMEKVIAYLYSMGHRRLGFVGHHVALGAINERRRAVLDAAERWSDLRVETAANQDSLEGGRRAARRLITSNPALTAIVCTNDVMALGALRELRDNGLRVPHDVSVTGFDDIKLAQFSDPCLTSVHISCEKIGRVICDRLFGPPALLERQFVIDPELVLRDSTGPARSCGAMDPQVH